MDYTPAAQACTWDNSDSCSKFSNMAATWDHMEDFKNAEAGTSLVAQWLGIRLPMQGTQV